MKRRIFRYDLLLKFALLLFLFSQCIPSVKRELVIDTVPSDNIKEGALSLKVHMKDGSLYMINLWSVNDSDNILKARGDHYDYNRKLIESSIDSSFKINLDDVALFETNKITGLEGKVAGMTLIMVPSTIVTIICIVDPKACFGSCPTFYAWNGTKMKLMAEGFSSSIARAFEKSDVDMLYDAATGSKEFRLRLTNEALETHMIEYADLLVFPRQEGRRIYATPGGKYYQSENILKPSSCNGPEGDCLEKVLEMDQSERFTATDPKSLVKKETVDVIFSHAPKGKLGLVIGSRQTFLTTFLFYQGMAHAGSKFPYYLAQVESGNETMQRHMTRLWDLLGGIEVLVQNDKGKWVKAGELYEMGPIAADLHLMPLPENENDEVRIKLRMTKGLWRIDQLSLVEMDQEVFPERISPSRVLKDTLPDEKAKKLLLESAQYLVTFPGDRYDLIYQLPDPEKDYEVFLYTRGYYLEWMREGWIEEEDMAKMAIMFGFPRQYLKMMGPEFKKLEPFMEEAFWGSRYVKN